MKIRFVYSLIILSGFFTFSYTQVFPEESQISAYQILNIKYNKNIEVNWNKKNGSPEIISFNTPIAFDNDRKESVPKFLKEIRHLLKYRTNKDTLVLIKEKESKRKKFYSYSQMYKGIPVKGGEYVVTELDDGKIQLALGNFYKDIELNTKPSISLNEALLNALKKRPEEIELKDSISSFQLIIYPKDKTYHLAYEMQLRTIKNQGSWTYIIDATNGNILYAKDNVIYCNISMSPPPPSQAYAYPSHPGLDGSYTTVSPLPNLYNNGYLQGTYANILNDETSRAYNADNDFRYSTGSTHFDEANLYYHIDKFRTEYLNDLGFDEFTQITAHVHSDFGVPNASYDPDDHHLRFSDGEGLPGYNSFAREDKIIYHEYTHAVTDYLSNISLYYNESASISEGNSDYFAGSYTGREVIGEYAASSIQRDMSNPDISTYSQFHVLDSLGLLESHLGGEYWSSCLWDLRTSLTASVADQIIIDALNYIPPSCTFLQYRAAIIAADNDNNKNTIKHIFYLKGIGTDSGGITTSGTLPGNQTWEGTVTLQGNVEVPTGVTLTIGYHSTIDLNTFSIISTGGAIVTDGSETIEGLQASIVSSQDFVAMYSSSIGTTTLSSGQIMSIGSLTVNGNITVQSGASCNINSGSTINLGTNSIISSGGTITKGSNVTINGLRATVKNTSQNIKALCGTISFAASSCGSSEQIEIESGTYTENVTLNGKYAAKIYGHSSTINGTVTIYSSNSAQVWDLSVDELHISNSNSVIVDNVEVTPDEEDGAFLTYNASGCDISSLNISSAQDYVGADFISSDGDIDGSSFTNFSVGAYFSNYCSDFTIYGGTEFCQNYTDIRTDANSWVQTSGCSFSSNPPPVSGNVYNANYTTCGLRKVIAMDGFLSNNQPVALPDDYKGVLNLFKELKKKIKEEKTKDSNFDKGKVSNELSNLTSEVKEFIMNNNENDLAVTALGLTASGYKQMEDYEGMKIFLDGIINDKNSSNLNGKAKRYMIDYYMYKNENQTALSTADEIINDKKTSEDLLSDALFAKGLVYEYSTEQKEEAVKIYEEIVGNYSDNRIAVLAKKHLKNLGKEVEEKENAAELNVVSNEIEISNYPNPFNPSTTIRYTLPEEGRVQLKIYDMLGREVATLIDEFRNAGRHSVIWDGNNSASGIYFYRITFNNKTLNKKMLLIK